MITNLADFRIIDLLVDPQKNIVIFPISKTNYPVELANGEKLDHWYHAAYYPIELKYPYSNSDLAEKIKFGIEQWNQHECYNDFSGKNTMEEKYYGVKGFKNAVKGNRYIRLGWDDIQGKYVSLSMPWKSGYAYMGLDSIRLSDDADWIDFANAVIDYINMDLSKLQSFKTCKRNLNI